MTTQQPVDPHVRRPGRPWRSRRSLDPRVLSVIALGGVLGSEARYALSLLWPARDGAWPAVTFWINVSGSLVLGAVIVLFTEVTSPHRLLRPFLGVGVLGGFTTFSTATLQVQALVHAGRVAVAVGYLLGSALAALAAAAIGATVMRVAAGARRRTRRRIG
jgi:fluoride exporter